jgi:hypothetical protein
MLGLKACLNKVSDWQWMGEISPSQESITSKIQQAALVGEITDQEKVLLSSMVPQLVSMVAGLKMVDIYRTARKLKADDADPTDSMPSVPSGEALDRPCDGCGMKLTGHGANWSGNNVYCNSCFGGFGYGGGSLLARKTAEVQPEEIDILIYALNELTDPLANTGDADLVMIQKLLSDFLQNLKTELQTSSTDQGDYQHSNDEQVNPGQGAEPARKETATPGGMG